MGLRIVGAGAAFLAVVAGCAASPSPPKTSPTQVQVNFNFNPDDELGSHKSIERGAVSGMPQHVGFYYAVNPDCTSGGLVQTRVKTQPAHGSVALVQADGYSHFPAGNPAFQCNSKKSPGIEVMYTSAKDFVGSDQFTVQGIGPKGKYMETDYTVNVLPPVSAQ
jgi:hypothetical protein